MTRATVLGATGFIGSHLTEKLRRRGFTVETPSRGDDLPRHDLGLLFFCIGLTGDAPGRPFETVAAHVEKVSDVLRGCRFDRLIYLSSTRVYLGAPTATETETLRIDAADPGRLFNLSKLAGESLVLHSGRGRIVRLSNVYGSDWQSENFLPTIVRDACRDHLVTIRDGPESAKDYVHVDDVVDVLIQIALDGREPLYNVASGRNVTHAALAAALRQLTGCRIAIGPRPRTVVFPPIDTTRLQAEFAFTPRHVIDELAGLVDDCRAWLTRSAAPAAE